jgi:thiamine transport system substrate-binding protein
MKVATALTATVCLLAGVVHAAGTSSRSTSVVLVTHDSFTISKPVRAAFERQTGLKLRILQTGDAGAALNRALLTAGKPEGDVFFGVDNNLLTRALTGNLLVPYRPAALATLDRRYDLDPTHRLIAVDHSEVCVVYDRAWFARQHVTPPGSIADLGLPRYRGLFVVENPATSTPGLAFLLATVARYGNDGWRGYWQRLRANKVLVTDGWEDAYEARFSGSSGHKGKRPIVVSYSTDPAAEVYFAGKPLTKSPVAVVPGTCFRQIEFAGVLRGAKNPDGARRLVDFLLSKEFQAGMPLTMFVLPTRRGVALPPVFRRFAPPRSQPLQLPAGAIGANRDRWIREWTDAVLR